MDEYQDINPARYELISALAGRTLPDEDDKLSLFAVGDDDQNIYAFDGASSTFIHRFEEDYRARPAFLTDNYRSSGHIVATANAVIGPARQRMKAGHPIGVDRNRANDPPGGVWVKLDPVARGRVQLLPAGDSAITQAQAAVAELQRLSSLSQDWSWSACAVVAREWRILDPVRSLCEAEGIPVQMANEDFSGFWHLRETRALVHWLRGRGSPLVKGADLNDWVSGQPSGPWTELLQEAVSDYAIETGGSEAPVDHFVEWLAEWGREARRRQRGLLLLTAHRAKGLEFDHVVVLDGGWDRVGQDEDKDAPRRLYYVAMTRARQTLTLATLPGPHPILGDLTGEALHIAPSTASEPAIAATGACEALSAAQPARCLPELRGIPESSAPRAPCHRRPFAGDSLQVSVESDRWRLRDQEGIVVGQLTGGFELRRTCIAWPPPSSPSPPGTESVPSRNTGMPSAATAGRWWFQSWFSNPTRNMATRCSPWGEGLAQLVGLSGGHPRHFHDELGHLLLPARDSVASLQGALLLRWPYSPETPWR